MSEIEETQLMAAEENLQQVEPAAEAATETPVEECVQATETAEATPSTKEEVVAQLKALVESGNTDRNLCDHLRVSFYKMHNEEVAAARQAFVEAGGNAEDFTPAEDPLEAEFKSLMATIKEKRAEQAAEAEAERKENLQKKLDIIEKIKEMVANPDSIDKNYENFKALETEWREIGPIPAENTTETWKNFQHQREQFYDLLRINHEMRAYDFKKNLEIKTRICEAAEKLVELDDVISAFHQLQKLHQEFRETGPVAKELREEIWTRFKSASTLINKRHQEHFLSIKADEEDNLKQKQTLCEIVENIDLDAIRKPAEWEEATKNIIALQAQWKSIGYAPRKVNQEIFERFRSACDRFFNAKTSHFRGIRESQSENLKLKTALCERAEKLQDSTDWGTTTNELVALQAEWKTIGPVPQKVSESIWKRFNTACNAFFNAKNAANKEQRTEEEANLQKKLDIVARLEALANEGSDNLLQDVRALQAEWNETGHVPFRKKDKLNRRYREICDTLYDTIHRSASRSRIDNAMRQGGKNLTPQQRLQKMIEEKRTEIKNYETNLTFLSSKSKSGNSLVADVEHRIERLKQELAELEEKLAQTNAE